MNTIQNTSADRTLAETALLETLRRDGPQFFESLIQQCGMGWAQVFCAIDTMSRSGMVRLRRIDGNRYLVSFSGKSA